MKTIEIIEKALNEKHITDSDIKMCAMILGYFQCDTLESLKKAPEAVQKEILNKLRSTYINSPF